MKKEKKGRERWKSELSFTSVEPAKFSFIAALTGMLFLFLSIVIFLMHHLPAQTDYNFFAQASFKK